MKDYCTLWPDFIGEVWIGGCCKAHDLAYATGLPRLQADQQLGKCVAELGMPVTAFLMAAGTALFGWIFYKRRR